MGFLNAIDGSCPPRLQSPSQGSQYTLTACYVLGYQDVALLLARLQQCGPIGVQSTNGPHHKVVAIPGPRTVQRLSRTFTRPIHIQGPGLSSTVNVEPENTHQPRAVDRLVAELEDAFTEQQAHQGVIEPGERDEANPWLRRTQWAVYLSGLDPQQLVNCVQRPSEADTDDDRAAAAI